VLTKGTIMSVQKSLREYAESLLPEARVQHVTQAQARKLQEQQSPADALASIRMAAINEGLAMAPEDVAAALRKWIAEHDADLIELLIGTVAPVLDPEDAAFAIRISDLQAEADRRRVGLS
jgi:hypothetical protein